MTDPEVPKHDTIRILCTDGIGIELALSVPWEAFIGQILQTGCVIANNVFINRQFIVRIERLSQPEPMSIKWDNIIPMGPKQ